MNSRKRLPPWHEEFRLTDGRQMLIRPARAEDAAPIRGAWPLYGPFQLRERIAHGDAVSIETLRRLTAPDPRSAFVLVAAEPLPAGQAMVAAIGAVTAQPGQHLAWFDLLSSRFVQGQGLSRHLLRRLVKWTRGRGIEQLSGDVAGSSVELRELARSMGFVEDPTVGSQDMVRLVLDLGAAEQPSPASEAVA